MFDAIVVGGGPAGLAAATWVARYRRPVLLLDNGEHRNRWVDHAHGYLGFDPVSPGELLERARANLERYPTAKLRPVRAERAAAVGSGGFQVEAGGGTVTGRRLILATGVRDRFPEVAGFFEHYGAQVFHCPSCDGYEARDRRVVVFGWNDTVAGFALALLDWAASVTVVTDGRRFEGDAGQRSALAEHNVKVLNDEAVGLLGKRDALEGVRLRGGDRLVCDLAFFSIAHDPASPTAEELGCRFTDDRCVAVDLDGRTSVPGVYAAGDMTPGLQLIQVAAAKGAAAGVACARSFAERPAQALEG